MPQRNTNQFRWLFLGFGGPCQRFWYHSSASERSINCEPTGRTRTASREEIIAKFQEFHPRFLRVPDLPAHSEMLKWQLRVLAELPTWVRGRTGSLVMLRMERCPSWVWVPQWRWRKQRRLGVCVPLEHGRQTFQLDSRLIRIFARLRESRIGRAGVQAYEWRVRDVVNNSKDAVVLYGIRRGRSCTTVLCRTFRCPIVVDLGMRRNYGFVMFSDANPYRVCTHRKSSNI
jgi:hypothetical protein